MWGALSDKRTSLQLTRTVVSGPRQSNHFRVQVPQNLQPYFTASYVTLPTWRARSLHLHSPGTGRPSYNPGHWVPFLSFLRLAGLRWKYSNPPSHGDFWFLRQSFAICINATGYTYIWSILADYPALPGYLFIQLFYQTNTHTSIYIYSNIK
jgi:hypothetical protein